MDKNTVLICACAVLILVVIAIYYFWKMIQKRHLDSDQLDTFAKVLDHAKNRLLEIDKGDEGQTYNSADFEREYRRKVRIREALANCVHGIESAKVIVIDLIRSIIASDVTPEAVAHILSLSENDALPPPNVQFEILLYRYKKIYGKKALTELIKKYHFADRHEEGEKKYNAAYYISKEDIENAYTSENIKLTQEEQAEVLAILVFQKYKGFGIIDTIREMDIDGINIGTSGALSDQRKQQLDPSFRVESSVWIYFSGTQLHMRFLTFENEDEIRRIVLAVIRYGNKGALTRNVGKVVTSAPDKARITALCPPAAESWAVFIRKFGFSDRRTEELIIKEYTHNGDLPLKIIQALMQGLTTTSFTGRQGSGKTTMMTSVINYIDPAYTIRTLEMAFELYLRDAYPQRNILAVQETSDVPAYVLQDTLKKTDAAVSIVGEVATDDVAARMIQMGQVASLFTIFSHHANTAEDLVLALRNSLVNAGGFTDMTTAERQVLEVVQVDVHLNATVTGARYIERITEIIPLPQGIPYPEYTDHMSLDKITAEYYSRVTDRRSFRTQDILRYNLDTNTYEMCGWFSEKLEAQLRNNCKENGVILDGLKEIKEKTEKNKR